jgi:hypothetical protein
MGYYWLDATLLSKLMPILTPKNMGHKKKPFIGLSWVQDYLSIHDIVCPHTTSCFFYVVGIPLEFFKHNFSRKKITSIYLFIYLLFKYK